LHARHLDFVVLGAGALAVLNDVGLHVDAADFGKPDSVAPPLYREVEFGKWIISHCDELFLAVVEKG
jgi:hypothetical protein